MKGNSLWGCNENQARTEVKYVADKGGLLTPVHTANESFRSRLSLIVSLASLLLAITLFTALVSWLWGVPTQLYYNNQEVKRLEHLLEKQNQRIQELQDLVQERANKVTVSSAAAGQPGERAADCLLAPAPGPCTTLSLQRWFYQAHIQQCQQFQYGGCGGNNNSFTTAKDCEQACRGVKMIGPVLPESTRLADSRSSPSRAVVMVPQVIAGERKTAAPLPVQKTVACFQLPESGPCKGQLHRFYWDNQQQTCLRFSYGGCAGNGNNFVTETECLNACRGQPAMAQEADLTVGEQLCSLDKDSGPCTGNITRWYYRGEDNSCREFGWGGCGGNANNFLNRKQCLARCGVSLKEKPAEPAVTYDDVPVQSSRLATTSTRPEACQMPKAIGDCRGSFRRYYYNTDTQQCEKFIYGGCGGNSNNFPDLTGCAAACEGGQQNRSSEK